MTSDFRTRRSLRTTILMLVVWSGIFSTVQADRLRDRDRDRLVQRRQEVLEELNRELRKLSDDCFQKGLADDARDLTALALQLQSPPRSPQLPTLRQLPISPRLPEQQRLVRNRIRVLREEAGSQIYRLARSALKADLPALAYRMVTDTLVVHPDHEFARGIVGQISFVDAARRDDPFYAGEWVSRFEAARRRGRVPEVNHPEFGWLPVSHVPRYEQGERFYRGKWISDVRERELRRNFQNAWEIRTEHFLVRTNTSLEEGVVVSRKLERFHDWLTTHFAAFFDTPEALEERFEQAIGRRGSVRSVQPMEVHFYATRDEYDRVIRKKNPGFAAVVTNGLYYEPDRTCYFFRNEDDKQQRTVFHEATHQILDVATIANRNSAARRRRLELRERKTRPWKVAENSNFWIIEGIACYFESLEIRDGAISVGDPSYARFVAAQHRLLQNNFYIPLRGLSGLGQADFQSHTNIRQLYSQASGVVHFLMHYQDGMYQDDLVALLSAIYRPDLKAVTVEPSLAQITGVPWHVLDQQYREHMGNLAEQLGPVRIQMDDVQNTP